MEHGVSERQLHDLARYQESDAFSPLERLVLDYTVEMTRTPVDVKDERFEELRKQFSDPQIVELTAAIAWENFRARMYHALGVEAGGFSEGAYCPLPERPFVGDRSEG